MDEDGEGRGGLWSGTAFWDDLESEGEGCVADDRGVVAEYLHALAWLFSVGGGLEGLVERGERGGVGQMRDPVVLAGERGG